MHWLSGILVFVVTWWLVFFAVLPFGLRRDHTGKPEAPKLWRKMLVTTAISAAFFLIIYWLIESGFINFREIVAVDAG